MAYTKADLKHDLAAMGLTGNETILIHSSMKSIGPVEGGADTVLDAWMEFFAEGLLLLPTHTWRFINEENRVFDVRRSPCCVGILPELFRQRPGVVRSLHPHPQHGGLWQRSGCVSGRGTGRKHPLHPRRLLRPPAGSPRQSAAARGHPRPQHLYP